MPLDNLFVNQKIELLEAFVGWETQNKYSVVNIRGDTVYHVVEESGIIGRMCMGSHRACEFHVFDMNRREVLRMTRPLRCSSCCCFCCLQELQVYSGQTLLGSVVQDWSLWRPSFTIRDNLDNEVLCIKGPWLRYCFDVSFEIRSLDNEHRVGLIAKRWSGLAREFFTDTDVFGMNFPLDLDVKIKAVLLGACLLIDFMYFESSGKQV